MRAHSHGVRGDSASCLLQYALLKLSKPGLASRPWLSLPPCLCQCQLQLGTLPAAKARFSLACGDACSPLKIGFFPLIHCFLPAFALMHCVISSSFVLVCLPFPLWFAVSVDLWLLFIFITLLIQTHEVYTHVFVTSGYPLSL